MANGLDFLPRTQPSYSSRRWHFPPIIAEPGYSMSFMSRLPASRLLRCALLLAMTVPYAVQAHPGHGLDHGWAQGVVHPFAGLDHLLAMLGVGLWAAQLGGRARWALPGAFLGVMAIGAQAGQTGLVLPGMESLILASVFVLGLVVATARRAPQFVAMGLTAAFALVHGWAHGSEMSAGADRGLYFGGFLMATAILLGAGLGVGQWTTRCGREPWLRWAGVGVAAGGILCLAA